ncbi:MAG: glutathione binding-like protein, partial [Pseudomonadota bacterium]
DIMKNEQFAPDFLKISPNNKIPAIVDHETGVSLMESGAILLYLAEKTGKLMPKGNDYWVAMQWLMMQMGSVGPMLGQANHFNHFNPDKSEYARKRYVTEAHRIYGVLEKRLGETSYLAGAEYSVADIATWPWLSRWEWHDVDLGDFPNITRWYLEIADRDAVQRGYGQPFEVGGIPRPVV